MIDKGSRNDNGEIRGSGDPVVDMIARLRSIPTIRPRLLFRLKVAWISRYPGGVAAGAEGAQGLRSGKKRALEPRPLWVSALRPVAVGILAACVAFSLFVGLGVLARNSRPGDPLYGVKRARESIQMAFAGNAVSKARENLNLAETRLSELENLVSSKSLTPDRVKYLAGEYNKDKKRVEQVIAGGGAGADTDKLKARLFFIESQKAIIASKIASGTGAESALVPASGARVTVSDPSGRPSLGSGTPSVTGWANKDGNFGFYYLAEGSKKADSLQAVVELDGRKTTVPLYPPAGNTSDSGAQVAKSPGGVSSVVTPLPGGGNRVELNNGLVRVVSDAETPGQVVKSLSPVGDAGLKVGPFEDPAVMKGSTGGNNPPVVRGPFPVSSGKASAAYEISFDLDYGGAKVHKSYEVELASGNSYVSVSCKTSIEGKAGGGPLTDAEMAEVLQMRLPRLSDLKIAGKPQVQANPDQPTFIALDKGSPFATFNCSGRCALLAFPDGEPNAWWLDADYLGVRLSNPTFASGGESSANALLGFSPEGEVASLVRSASRGATAPFTPGTEATNGRGEGFDIVCNPAPDRLAPGRQAIMLTIRKQYEKLSDYLK